MSIRPSDSATHYSNDALAGAVTLLNAAATGAHAGHAGKNHRVRIACIGAAVWAKLSKGLAAAATAGGAAEILIPVGIPTVIEMGEHDNLSIINDGAGCKVSSTIL